MNGRPGKAVPVAAAPTSHGRRVRTVSVGLGYRLAAFELRDVPVRVNCRWAAVNRRESPVVPLSIGHGSGTAVARIAASTGRRDSFICARRHLRGQLCADLPGQAYDETVHVWPRP